MFQVRFHGRGGQGVVTAAELLASAAFLDGLRPDRYVLVNSSRGVDDIGLAALTRTECPVSLELKAVTYHA